MLTVDLQKIISDINARRKRVRYEFQETGLMLAAKLNDPRHKSLYMKLAKYEEHELLMDSLRYILATPNLSGNVGALFMWKLKELKNRPILPVSIRFVLSDSCYFIVGRVLSAVRGDMPTFLAIFREYEKSHLEELMYSGTKLGFPNFIEFTAPLLKKFKARGRIELSKEWTLKGSCSEKQYKDQSISGYFMLNKPVLTKQEYKRKMPAV